MSSYKLNANSTSSDWRVSTKLDFVARGDSLASAVPAEANLLSLNYEENKSVILRGTYADLNTVFSFVASIQKSPAFAKFNIKIKYATTKKTQYGEIVEFEIACLK